MTAPIEALQRRVGALEAELFAVVEQLRQVGATADRNARTLDDLEDVLTEMAATGLAAGSTTTPSKPAPTRAIEPDELQAWVDAHLAPLVRKTTTTGEGGGIRWCRHWTEHAEAVQRFSALYLAYEQLSKEDSGTWLSVYLRDHLDPHLATLSSPYGPFFACTPRLHSTTADALGHVLPGPIQLMSQP